MKESKLKVQIDKEMIGGEGGIEREREWERTAAETFSSRNIQSIKIRKKIGSSRKNLSKMV